MKKSLSKTALIISFGTLLSKFAGMTRELLLAGVFGVGAAYDAYNYAYAIPGFFLILIGGINGPIHNAVVTVLSKKDSKEANYIANSINISISSLLLIISIFLYLLSGPIISIIGPGLDQESHNIAVEQLQIMSPIILLSGLIGIGFGALNSRKIFFITSASPIISSLSVIVGVSFFWFFKDSSKSSLDLAIEGGNILAKSTLIGALLQWIIQIPLLARNGLLKIRARIDIKNKGVRDVLKIIAPAILSSGMLQINVITDLFFASSIAGAAAGLGYANFLIQAPLGIISSSLLLPLLPILSNLYGSNQRRELIKTIKKSFVICSGSMVFLGSIFVALGPSIVDLFYGRGKFDYQAIDLVGGLLIVYGIGMPLYLCRDLLVRVFYSLGDGYTPFKYSSIGIILNIFLDWSFMGGPTPWGMQIPIYLGVKGIVLATVGVNFFTCLILFWRLNSKLASKLPINAFLTDFFKLLICGLISGIIAFKVNLFISSQNGFLSQLITLTCCFSVSILSFLIASKILKIKEIDQIIYS